MTAAEAFDLRAYTVAPVGSYRDLLDFGALHSSLLDERNLSHLKSFADVEKTAIDQMRQLLITPTHKDPKLTAFLTTWAYEKFWITEALEEALRSMGSQEPRTAARPQNRSNGSARTAWAAIRANLIGPTISTTQLTVAAIDEWIMRAAYTAFIQSNVGTPVAKLLATVLAVKAKHLKFFETEARTRLAASKRAQRLTIRHLRGVSWPTGLGSRGRNTASQQWLTDVLADRPDLVAEVNTLTGQLPGLARLKPPLGGVR